MRHSIYLNLAVLCVKADLRREERVWKRTIRRTAHDIPWHNPHLLRDIGLDIDGLCANNTQSNQLVAENRVYTIRRLLRRKNTAARITT
jgi:hypothetical protein